ncbi:dynein regulatory complex subunit 2-like [Leptopilina heterotoma]|uniref:dynein regulatory complex subunit 2-like n=1 Tax=Leptopilina heterotoma TaxID=63436 RepID=UPI001CA90179|nr:dynein regulatory complex subunit 2-like [Leptopilina heterotoma]
MEFTEIKNKLKKNFIYIYMQLKTQPETRMEIQMVKKTGGKKKAKVVEKRERKRLDIEERKKNFQKERLKREIQLGSQNAIRLQQSWREIMMKIKMPNIKENIQNALHTFNRVLDFKDYSISLLLDAIDNAEEQYQMSERDHIEKIDEFLKIHKIRLESLEFKYETNLENFLNEFKMKMDKINCDNEEETIYLQTTLLIMNQKFDESLNKVKSTLFGKTETQANDFQDIRKIEEGLKIKSITNSWQELHNVFADYEWKTKERRNAYENLKAKDQFERNIIANQMELTVAAFEEIRKLKKKIANIKLANEEPINDIMQNRNFFQESYWIVKNRFLNEQATDKNLLKVMAIEYNQTIHHLNRLFKKLENILILTQICQKYETENEKLIPTETPIIREEKIITELNWTRCLEVFTKKTTFNVLNLKIQISKKILLSLKELKFLEHFWKRVGSVTTVTAELKNRHEILKEESNYLCRCLKHYISKEKR